MASLWVCSMSPLGPAGGSVTPRFKCTRTYKFSFAKTSRRQQIYWYLTGHMHRKRERERKCCKSRSGVSNLGLENEVPCVSCMLCTLLTCSTGLTTNYGHHWHACYPLSHPPPLTCRPTSSPVCTLWSLNRHSHTLLCSISDETRVFPFKK